MSSTGYPRDQLMPPEQPAPEILEEVTRLHDDNQEGDQQDVAAFIRNWKLNQHQKARSPEYSCRKPRPVHLLEDVYGIVMRYRPVPAYTGLSWCFGRCSQS